MSFLKNRKGFSLAELIIYLGILGISTGILGGMLNTITTTQVSEFNQNEVSGQLNFAIQTIQRYIRGASIIQGDSGVPSSTLVLQMPIAAQNPTTLYLQNNRIYVTQGTSGTPQVITNDKVSIDNLEFRRFAQPASKDVVQIDIAISQQSNGGQRIARSLRSAITRVNAAAFDSDLIPNTDGSYNIGTYPSARWKDGSFSGQVSAGSLCFASDCRTSWANIAGVSGSGSANYLAKWDTASTIKASTLLYDDGTSLGIGAINPGYKLDVQGGQINASGGLCINGDCKTGWSQVAGAQTWIATGTSIYYNTGNVGIGTTAPTGAWTRNLNINDTTSGGSAGVTFSQPTKKYSIGINGTNLQIYDGTASQYRLTMDTNGKIGIGTTAPTAKLQIASTTTTEGLRITSSDYSPFIIRNSSDTADLFRITQTGTTTIGTLAGTGIRSVIVDASGVLSATSTSGGSSSQWTTTSTSIYYNTGNVGIGTTAPAYKLDVGGVISSTDTTNSNNIHFLMNGYAGNTWRLYGGHGGGGYFGVGENASAPFMVVSAGSGNVGIGTSAPSAALHIYPKTNTEGLRIVSNNYSPFVIRNSADSADLFRVAQDGTITAPNLATLRRFIGATTQSYSGQDIGGYDQADAICNSNYPGSRMCVTADFAIGRPTVTGWYNTFSFALYSSGWYVTDCNGWKSGNPLGASYTMGNRWEAANGFGRPVACLSGNASPLLCCQ